MKNIILLATCVVATQSFAQVMKLDMGRVKKFVDKNNEKQSVSPAFPRKNLNQLFIKKSMIDTVAYSHTTPQGDVFILPQDSMPCLQPKENGYVLNMPNAMANNTSNETKVAAPIPNAFKGRSFQLVFPKKMNPPITDK